MMTKGDYVYEYSVFEPMSIFSSRLERYVSFISSSIRSAMLVCGLLWMNSTTVNDGMNTIGHAFLVWFPYLEILHLATSP
jgi:hypothetical protein